MQGYRGADSVIIAEEEKPEKVASQAKENEEVVVYAALLRDPVFPAEEAMLK